MAKPSDDLVKKTTTKAVRDKARRRAKERLSDVLFRKLRKIAGMRQTQLAAAPGIKQPSLSKLEGRRDMQVSTLRRIVEALGGELELIVRLPKTTVRVRQFDGGKKRRAE